MLQDFAAARTTFTHAHEAQYTTDTPDPAASSRCHFSTSQTSHLRLGSAFGEPTCAGEQKTTTITDSNPVHGVLPAAGTTSPPSGAPRSSSSPSPSHANAHANALDFTCRRRRFPGHSRHVGRGASACARKTRRVEQSRGGRREELGGKRKHHEGEREWVGRTHRSTLETP